MIAKIKKFYKTVERYNLTDVRTIGFIVFGFIVVAVSWSGSQTIQQNFELQKKVNRLQAENEVYQLENQSQALVNEYYKSSEFRELEARRQFGKAAPGEVIYVVPKEVALKNVKSPAPSNNVNEKSSKPTTTPVKKPFYQENLQAWTDFFLHRRSQ